MGNVGDKFLLFTSHPDYRIFVIANKIDKDIYSIKYTARTWIK